MDLAAFRQQEYRAGLVCKDGSTLRGNETVLMNRVRTTSVASWKGEPVNMLVRHFILLPSSRRIETTAWKNIFQNQEARAANMSPKCGRNTILVEDVKTIGGRIRCDQNACLPSPISTHRSDDSLGTECSSPSGNSLLYRRKGSTGFPRWKICEYVISSRIITSESK